MRGPTIKAARKAFLKDTLNATKAYIRPVPHVMLAKTQQSFLTVGEDI